MCDESKAPEEIENRKISSLVWETIRELQELIVILEDLEDPSRVRPLGKLTDHVETPPYILEGVAKMFGEYHDPCPYMSYEDHFNEPWKDFNYVNPPYSDIEPWFKKAIDHANDNKGKSILLIPFWTYNDYWELCNSTSCQILIVRDPYIKFPGYKCMLPFKMCFVFFGFKWSEIIKGLKKQSDLPDGNPVEKVNYFGNEHHLVMFCGHLCERVTRWPM